MHMDKGVIFESADVDPAKDRVVLENASGRITIVSIAKPEQAIAVARELVDAGATLVELCGGLSPIWRTKVANAIGGRAMVSSVTYGIESLEAGVRYKQAFERGEVTKEAFILLQPGADPVADRFEMGGKRPVTRIVPVPDDAAAARVADELAGEGVGLIELYGGLSTTGIAMVIDAVAGRAAVGANSFALDTAPDPAAAR